MGVPGLWTELNDAGYDISLNLLAIQSFNKITTSNNSSSKHPKRALVLGIDVSIWFFHAAQQGKNILRYAQEANKRSESDLTLLPLKILFYRLGMLLAFPVHVLFICDGPGRPVHKRGKNIITTGFSKLQRDFLNLVDAFGFRYRVAPGEAEAELAYLNQIGVVDVVMTDDVDTLLFGAKEVILNWSPTTAANKARRRRQRDSDSEASSSHENEDSDSDPMRRINRVGKKSTIKDPKDDERISEKLKKSRKETWVTVFNAQEIEDDPLIYLTKEGLILIALLSKGDYTPGVQGFGVRTAVPLAKAGFGKELIENYQKFCQRIPPPTFQLVSNEGNITKSARPTSSLKHLFKAYPSKKSNDLESAEWRSFLKDWIHRIQHELTTDSKGFFRERDHNKQPKLANSMGLINFMTTSKEIEALDSYIYPVISKDIDKELYEKANSFKGRTTTEDSGNGLGLGGEEIKWKEPDPRLIAKQAQEAFGWNREKTLNKMRNRIWQGMVVRQLRREAMRRDRGETSENSKIPNNRDHENQTFQTPSKPSRYQSNFLSPMTPGSSSSTPSILSNLSPLSSVTTPSGSQHYLNDTTKSVEVPSNQKEAQKFAHENGLAYLLACHLTRKDREVGNVKEYRLEIDPTGFVKRANADLVDEVENLSEEMKNLQSGDEGDAAGEGTEKIKKVFEPPLKPLRLWIAQDLLYFDSRGKQLMKELDEKVRKKNIEKEEKEMRKKLGINKKGKKTNSNSNSKAKSKSKLEKGKGKGRSGFTSDEEEDDEIFGSESDDDDGEGDLTVKASNVTSSSNRFKSQPAPKNSTPPYSNVASTSKFKPSSSNPVLNSFQRKNKGSEPITLSDSDDEPNSSKSKPPSKSKPKSKPNAKLPESSTQSSKLKLPSKHLIFDDDDDDEDDSLPNAYDAIRGIKSSNRKIRNRSPSNPSSEASDLEKSPRKKDKPNRVGSSKVQEKRKAQNQGRSDVEIEDGDDSVVLISNPTASTSTSNNRTLIRNSKDEPIVLSD